MTLLPPLLRKLRAPSLVLASLLLATACASAPARPPVSIGTGQPRVDPVTGEPVQAKPGEEVDDLALEPYHRDDGGLTPDFMVGKDVKRAAVLLPFSHPSANVRTEAEAMLAGIELALFELAGTDFMILPKDTAGRASTAEARADEAIKEGADIILGPLFAANVGGVKDAASRKSLPVVAFSNDKTVAGGGVYLASIMPEEEVIRVMGYAASRGTRTFVFLGPDSTYGKQVEAAMRAEAAKNGWRMASSAFYPADSGAGDQARQIASVIKAETAVSRERIGVMIPERGVKLLAVAPLLPYNGVDLGKVRLLGTSAWDDSSIWREPALEGALFATSDPDNMSTFKDTYHRIYGRAPSDLAAAAYDAAAMAVSLSTASRIQHSGVTDPNGFMGVNGLFRYRLDGTAQRGLAVKQISGSGAAVVEKGITQFPPGGS
ncbi:penicillin-binding protein activator [Hyphomonas sp. WL0036]|uniref:penicillin-binding protein activator n=1 Tax=Hyphomonas sediminis TaxID=2866160 RepID=UPI001C81B0E5|nr:penicillin-binding protein activator [Hyphomonas sediminis]MBY9065273.1 penicillin-binding protein activator [Hyphomonas sediminis]